MKKFVHPEIRITKFDVKDIITSSREDELGIQDNFGVASVDEFPLDVN